MNTSSISQAPWLWNVTVTAPSSPLPSPSALRSTLRLAAQWRWSLGEMLPLYESVTRPNLYERTSTSS